MDQRRPWRAPSRTSCHWAAVYAWRVPTLGFAAMRRPIALLLAGAMLFVPSAALAQSAGDEQYADPFGEVEEPSGSQEEPAAPAEPAPAPATAETGVPPAEEAVASQETAAPTLPATGLPIGLMAGAGAALFAAGGALRRRVS